MTYERFEKLVNEALKVIPEKFDIILKKENIKVAAREKTPGIIKRKSNTQFVLGAFIGIPYNKRSIFNIQTEPTRIELYKESFEKVFFNENAIKSQIVKTVIHEIAHYFGFSEEEIRKNKY